MTIQSTLPNAPSAEQFERMYPDGEACAKAARNGRISITSDEFSSRNPGSGETHHVVAADSKQ